MILPRPSVSSLGNIIFPLTSETEGRPPWACGPGAALAVLRIAKNVSTAVGTSFAARRLRLDDRHRNFNYSTRTSAFFIPEGPLYQHRPALGASVSYHSAFACWAEGWCASARCPLTRPLQPRGIMLLDLLENGFFPWPPKTADEPHSPSLFSVQGESESLPSRRSRPRL